MGVLGGAHRVFQQVSRWYCSCAVPSATDHLLSLAFAPGGRRLTRSCLTRMSMYLFYRCHILRAGLAFPRSCWRDDPRVVISDRGVPGPGELLHFAFVSLGFAQT